MLGLAICRVPGHGDMHSLCICLILTSGTFSVTGCLSSISYASWGNRRFQILVFMPLWGKLRDSLISPLLLHGTAHFLLHATTGSEYLYIAAGFQVQERKWGIGSHSHLTLGLRQLAEAQHPFLTLVWETFF